ncbi:alkene reductase [Nocardioides litoris]|uniref:alkene reductase n=1 Tax=Nocardioides litoris TaxID=1926648 RepID=UPI0011210767|nr:alkene reductase [Nocardioides litoris]
MSNDDHPSPSAPAAAPTGADALLEPVTVGRLRLPNRVVMAPMSRVRATADGLATPLMATYFAQRASAGLIVSDGVQPSLVGQSNPGTPGLHTDEQEASWRQVTGAVHDAGGHVVAQLMHGGRVSHPFTTGHQPVAPSAVPATGQTFTPRGPQDFPVPRALATSEVAEQAASYAEAAVRGVRAGFDGVELHGANGYLVAQFLSDDANLRTDRYGGSTTGRIRFAVEAVGATADAVGADRVGIRLSPGSGIWGAHETAPLETHLALLAELSRLDLAYVHLEATLPDDDLLALRRAWEGVLVVNPVHPASPVPAGRDDAIRWRRLGADLVSLGRAFIANPDLVERLRHDLPLAAADPATYYTGGERGYLDYPALGERRRAG